MQVEISREAAQRMSLARHLTLHLETQESFDELVDSLGLTPRHINLLTAFIESSRRFLGGIDNLDLHVRANTVATAFTLARRRELDLSKANLDISLDALRANWPDCPTVLRGEAGIPAEVFLKFFQQELVKQPMRRLVTTPRRPTPPPHWAGLD